MLTGHSIRGIEEQFIREEFLSLKSPRELAQLLDVKYNKLVYHIYIVKPKEKYKHFFIPKKSGSKRKITAPISAIKLIQRKLKIILSCVYKPKATVHGFVAGKSIVTNATMHTSKKNVLNIDLKDFFPSINFGRVRGMFMATPYNLPQEVATVISQICCYKDRTKDYLPQGAPTSPIISNMLCAKMDSQLRQLAIHSKCSYTRYCDDISFSTSLKSFPKKLVVIKTSKEGEGEIQLGKELANIIKTNGFEINDKKVRVQGTKFRQEVTGLTVNKFTNVKRKLIREIRAILNAIKKYGVEAAESEYLSKYKTKYRSPTKGSPKIIPMLRGKIEFIGMVKGKQDSIYLKYLNKYNELIGKPLIPLPDIHSKHERLKKEVHYLRERSKKIEEEVDVDIEPFHFDFLSKSSTQIANKLKWYNKKMQRAKKKDDFFEFCSLGLIQLESSIKEVISNHEKEIYSFAETHHTYSLKKYHITSPKLIRAPMYYLVLLITDYFKDKLFDSDWLISRTDYKRRESENPYSNNTQIIECLREVRNLASHDEGSDALFPAGRISDKIKEIKKEVFDESKKSTTSNKYLHLKHQLQTLEDAQLMSEDRKYEIIEECLYKYIEVILA